MREAAEENDVSTGAKPRSDTATAKAAPHKTFVENARLWERRPARSVSPVCQLALLSFFAPLGGFRVALGTASVPPAARCCGRNARRDLAPRARRRSWWSSSVRCNVRLNERERACRQRQVELRFLRHLLCRVEIADETPSTPVGSSLAVRQRIARLPGED